ncbi:MAG: transglycosylase domain-containing protein, partial [Anaerovoracaceae bacterium]
MSIKKHKFNVTGKGILKFGLGFIAAMTVFLVLYSVTVISAAPKINTENLYSYLSESSVLYDDEGKQIDNIFIDGGNRINVSYEQMPKDLINAVVSIEDKTFWKHHGFNIVRIFGAIKESIFSGGNISGTSTITQQLARNVYLSETKSVRSLNRKVSEAWYTIILEKNLSKEQIVEAYLNTIYFGHNSYGVEAASQAYFSKNAADLDLLECASLAAIPKSPDAFALVKTLSNDTIAAEGIELDQTQILQKSADFTTIYNGQASVDRRNATLEFMTQQGYITEAERDAALADELSAKISIRSEILDDDTAYFSEFVVEQVVADLMKEGYSKENARKMVYTGGLKIYTTLNIQAQKAIETEFNEGSNFPSVDYKDTRFDGNKNIISKEGNLLLYSYNTYLPDGFFVFKDDEITLAENGDLILTKNKRLNFYKTQVQGETDYSVEFKSLYTVEDNIFYSIESGALIIPKQYKTLDGDGNLVISAKFLQDHPDFFTVTDGVYSVGENNYTLKQKVRQPQAAMVICDNKTGAVKA